MEPLDKFAGKRVDNSRKKDSREDEHGDRERKIDEQLDQSFPASDPPSYSQPGNELEE